MGGFTPELALKISEEKGDLIAFGRPFISNVSGSCSLCVSTLTSGVLPNYSQPDLPIRILKGIPLTRGDRTSYYAKEDPKGYIDYPFADPDAGCYGDFAAVSKRQLTL